MKRYWWYVVAFIVIFGGVPAAWGEPPITPSGYISLGGGFVLENFDQDDVPEDVRILTDIGKSGAIDARLGLRFERFAGEIEAMYLTGFDVSALGVSAAAIDGWSVGGNLKTFITTGHIVQPYLAFGMRYLEAEASALEVDFAESDGAVFKGGVGVETFVSPRVSLYGEWSYHQPLLGESIQNLAMMPFLLGVSYHFQ